MFMDFGLLSTLPELIQLHSDWGGTEGGEVDGRMQRGDGGVGGEGGGGGSPGRTGTCDEKNMDSCRQDKLISSVWEEQGGF